MTIGPTRKVLNEVAAAIAHAESGTVTLVWSTAHNHRVVEISDIEPVETGSGEAVRTGAEPVDYVALGLPSNATPEQVQERTAPDKPASNPVAQAFKDAWLALFPKGGR
jgi:hypothetical protein